MASPTSTPPRPEPSRAATRLSQRTGAHRERGRGWPSAAPVRWAIRGAFAVPFVVLAALAYGHGFQDHTNRALVARAKLIDWGSSDLSFVGHIYPPIPTAIAAIVPSALGLGIIGALAAGTMLEIIASRLVGRGYPLGVALLLVVTFGASPSFALIATTDLSTFLTLTLLAVALEAYLRFAFRGYTHAGFRAGLAVGLAALCDPVAIVCAVGFAVSAPLIAHRRYRDEPAAGRATAAVLLFPTVAGLAGWTFLCWRFTGSPLAWLHDVAPAIWTHEGIGEALRSSLTAVWLTPVFALAIVLLIADGHLIAAAGACVPLLAMWVAMAVGLDCPPSFVAVVLGIVGLAALPRRPKPLVLVLVIVVCLSGLTAKWAHPVTAPIKSWEHAVSGQP